MSRRHEPNLQNIPIRGEASRRIAPKNQLLNSADYSQIELSILAHTVSCRNHPERTASYVSMQNGALCDDCAIPYYGKKAKD